MHRAPSQCTRLGPARLLRTIVNGVGTPRALAFDSGGNLYVANAAEHSVTVYGPGASSPFRTIRQGISAPQTLTFDSSGNLYVGNGFDTVSVYAPNSSTPLQIIANGIEHPTSLAFDLEGRLYVANAGGRGNHGFVSVFSPGGVRVIRTIATGINNPVSMTSIVPAMYVVNDFAPGSVSVYGIGASTPLRTITNGMAHPDALAIGNSQEIYVANAGSPGRGSVAVYRVGSSTAIQRITRGIDSPVALKFQQGGTPATNITEYAVPSAGAQPYGLAIDANENVWVAEFGSATIGELTANRSWNQYPAPSPSSGTVSVTIGPDGNPWFVELYAGNIGKIDLSASPPRITEYQFPGTDTWFPEWIAVSTARETAGFWVPLNGTAELASVGTGG